PDNGKPCIRFQTSKYIGIASLTQALPYTFYVYLKNSTFHENIIAVFGGDYHQSILQMPSNNGGIGATALAAGSNYLPVEKKTYKADWHLYRFTNVAGNLLMTVDDGPVIGDLPGVPYTVGTSAISRLTLGDDEGDTADFFLQEFLLLDHNPSADEHKNLWNYFKNKYNPTPITTYYAFGDSITYGDFASDEFHKYAWEVGNGLNADYYNAGIAGTTIGYSAVRAGNSLDMLVDALDFGFNTDGYLTFAYGANETVDANWADYYQAIIQKFLDRGFNKNRVCIVSEFNGNANAIAAAPYCAAIAANLGIRYADCYTYSLTADPAVIFSGAPHISDAGNAAMASIILAAFAA
ncbi:MAG: SGNH/GDSL hydrolase family protein, partial [Mucilaginibacter sp.]